MNLLKGNYEQKKIHTGIQRRSRIRVNRRYYVTRAEARADIFDYIETFYNRRKRRKLGVIDQTALN